MKSENISLKKYQNMMGIVSWVYCLNVSPERKNKISDQAMFISPLLI